MPPKGAVAFPQPALSTIGPREQQTLPRDIEGRDDASTVSEVDSSPQVGMYDEADEGGNSARSLADHTFSVHSCPCLLLLPTSITRLQSLLAKKR